MTDAELCAEDGCKTFPEFPDSAGWYYCRDHYDGPADFAHVPDEPTGYRTELQEKYDA